METILTVLLTLVGVSVAALIISLISEYIERGKELDKLKRQLADKDKPKSDYIKFQELLCEEYRGSSYKLRASRCEPVKSEDIIDKDIFKDTIEQAKKYKNLLNRLDEHFAEFNKRLSKPFCEEVNEHKKKAQGILSDAKKFRSGTDGSCGEPKKLALNYVKGIIEIQLSSKTMDYWLKVKTEIEKL